MSERPLDAPSDLPLRWTLDGLVCETRPWRRTFGAGQLGVLGTVISVGFFVWPLASVVVLALAVGWILFDWWRDMERGKQRLVVTITPGQLWVEITKDPGQLVLRERVALTTIGNVEVSGTGTNHAMLHVRVAGQEPLTVPVQNESSEGARWLAAAVQRAAKAARANEGPGRVPLDLKRLLSRKEVP